MQISNSGDGNKSLLWKTRGYRNSELNSRKTRWDKHDRTGNLFANYALEKRLLSKTAAISQKNRHFRENSWMAPESRGWDIWWNHNSTVFETIHCTSFDSVEPIRIVFPLFEVSRVKLQTKRIKWLLAVGRASFPCQRCRVCHKRLANRHVTEWWPSGS